MFNHILYRFHNNPVHVSTGADGLCDYSEYFKDQFQKIHFDFSIASAKLKQVTLIMTWKKSFGKPTQCCRREFVGLQFLDEDNVL
ncbi:MAG: hypothetical protein R2827_03565 [Bdellovibrionales bacterium]